MKSHKGPDGERYFKRMTLNQRIQHIALMSSFFTLVLTGFPVTFPGSPASSHIIQLLGGFTMRSVLHRSAALVLICLSVYHLFYMLLTRHGRSELRALRPRVDDLLDAIEMVRFYLGFSSHTPKFDRYNYIEKFEYLALAWGTVVMIGTGLALGFQDQAMLLLPKWALDVAKVIHSYEALLAFLAIIIWHFYHVHLNPEVFPMSRVWLDGNISEHELRTLHPREYARIMAQESGEQQAAKAGPEPRAAVNSGRSVSKE